MHDIENAFFRPCYPGPAEISYSTVCKFCLPFRNVCAAVSGMASLREQAIASDKASVHQSSNLRSRNLSYHLTQK